MKIKKIEVGDVFPTNEGGSVAVVEYMAWDKIVVRHIDNHGHLSIVRSGHLIRGKVKNPFWPSVFGSGYLGVGVYRCREAGKLTPAYRSWSDMLQRCYGVSCQARCPTYVGCTVADEWHNFQVFAEWFYRQAFGMVKGFALDKDLIVFGNKNYSAQTCSFVPQSVNKLLLDSGAARGNLPQGVRAHRKQFVARAYLDGKACHLGTHITPEAASRAYVIGKELIVKAVAEKWKDFLHPEVYKNLCTWEVSQ